MTMGLFCKKSGPFFLTNYLLFADPGIVIGTVSRLPTRGNNSATLRRSPRSRLHVPRDGFGPRVTGKKAFSWLLS